MSRLAVTRADGPIVEDERRDVVLLIPLRDIRYEGLFRHVKLDSISEVLAPAPSSFPSWFGSCTYAWRNNHARPTLRGQVEPATQGEAIKGREADVEAGLGGGFRYVEGLVGVVEYKPSLYYLTSRLYAYTC